MSEGHFCRVFKQYTLKTPVQFINGVRLSHALELLTATNLRVLDIAMDCGFNSMSYFIEVFRTEYDATPLQYRKKLEEIGLCGLIETRKGLGYQIREEQAG